MSRRIVRPALVAALLLTFASAGYAGSGPLAASSTKVQPVPKIAAEVPASIKAKGTLIVAADATYAPNEFVAANGHTVIGMDPDLAQALAGVLGLKFKVVNAHFDTIIPGLKSGKYDIGMSSFTDTKAREKVVDFVTYFSAGTSFFVKAAGGPNIRSLADLCGKSVSVESGTTEQTDAATQNATCKKQGKPGVNVEVYPDQNSANLALASGRAQVGMADSPVAAYQVKQSHGKFKLSGKPYGTAPYGIALPKKNGMANPVRDALKYLMGNGTYTKILEKWGIQAGAISKPVINGATS